ncbi:MAG: hypothetical protein F4Y80_08165 [Caldilineaceae bacterium SB0665_bin_21]|nr:hypothetical protein [Caldilineaceae bacterium SB0665_bin_21]MYA04478.1 hypothetical protein [Caldilineaceae bacterium SB0664_bin_22]MYC64674.1 hypothetical protein [Caldilineaceae bacterium SB0661_bin_34]
MTPLEVHEGLSRACLILTAVTGLWALWSGIRNQALSGSWMGTALVCELLLLAQFLVGGWLWFFTEGWYLPRPYLHVLYGIVVVISLPAAWGWLSRQQEERARSFGMAGGCVFIVFALLRAIQVA